MSIKVVHEEIERFLKSSEPEVLCIKGKWGVGKTYAWNRFLGEVTSSGCLGMEYYSYVSLFGLRSLSDVRCALFENRVAAADITRGPSVESLEKNLTIGQKGKKALMWGLQTPFIQSYIGESANGGFFFVRNQIICIDDLERAGGDLTAKDVMGLITDLKEQRGCKVVLLMNDEELSEQDKTDYEKQLEKVIDTRLDFSPTPSEAADVVFPSREGLSGLIHKHCVTLGITNIRVIKKIERLVRRFEEIFGPDSPLMHQVTHSTSVLGWVFYQPDIAPPIEFLTDMARLHGVLREKEKTPPAEKEWQELMRNVGYANTDEFDLVIWSTIQNGYFDVDSLKRAGNEQLERMKTENRKQAFADAWNLYHDSFDNNGDAVLEALCKAAKENVLFIEPMNLDSTVCFLKEFGKDTEAKELLDHYIETRSSERNLFDLSNSFFGRDVKDPQVREVFKEKEQSFQDTRDPIETLKSIGVNRGWNPADITVVSKMSASDFYNLFKSSKGRDLHLAIRGALMFRGLSDATDQMKEITQNATTALMRIGRESPMNKRRVGMHGIVVEEEPVPIPMQLLEGE